MIEELLRGIGLKDEEIKTYLVLLEIGPNTVGNLTQHAGISRTSLYDVLARLQEKGIVGETLKFGIKRFFAENPEKIELIFKQCASDAQNLYEKFQEIVPALKQKSPARLIAPHFQVFEGQKEVQHVLRDLLLYRDIETISCMPIKTAIELAGKDFFRNLNIERIKRKISVRALWPQSQIVSLENHPYMGNGNTFLREIRIPPKEVEFEMGYWIYASKVLFLSSKKEKMGFIIESPELVQLLKTQFEFIWSVSKPLQDDSSAPQHFIEKEKLN